MTTTKKEIILKKISPKYVCGVIKKLLSDEPGEETKLMRVWGQAKTFVVKASKLEDFEDSICLLGDFKASSYLEKDDGRSFRSSACYLPSEISQIIAAELERENSDTVEFAFDVTVITNDTIVGYEYRYEALVEMNTTNPLSEMEERLEILTSSDSVYGSSEHTKIDTPKKKGRKKKAG